MSKIAKGISTTYAGTLFRSRLEARWAVFFDLLQWPWAYEPVDLEFYIPDFILRFDAGPIAVEVKPELALTELATYASRMVQSGWSKDLLVVGAVLFGDVIGVTGEPIEEGETMLGPALVFRCIDCGAVSFLNEDNSYRCRVRGCYGGNSHVGSLDPGELAALWAKAGNRVQWKGPSNEAAE